MKQIEELKNSLALPSAFPKKQEGGPPPAVSIGFNRFKDPVPAEDSDGKFNKVMDWGTPRLVTKNRELVMDQK